MHALLRKSRLFFALAAAAAIALRAIFILKFHRVDGDSLIYGDIARNWLAHGIFGVSTTERPLATYIRLPGYPGFLAAIWSVTGPEHYTAVLIVQLFVDLATCFVVADLARRLVICFDGFPLAARTSSPSLESARDEMSRRAAKNAFLLAALCPFLATYVAAPLTETLAIFFAAAALDAAVAGLDGLWNVDSGSVERGTATGLIVTWGVCGITVAASILLRPDGGILLAAIEAYLSWLIIKRYLPIRSKPRNFASVGRTFLAASILGIVALAPLIPWSIRNWHDFHRFQPLAPRYANAPDEHVNYGFERWTKTWMLDFVSVSEIYWNMPDAPIDTGLLPDRAFDSPDQREATQKLFAQYEETGKWTPDLDDQLGRIADERIAHSPLRYYVWLPAGRISDMWLRPRTELLGINDRWWEFRDDLRGAFSGSLLGLVNLLYVAAAVSALLTRRRQVRYIGLFIVFVVLRSAFLGTLENPEPRYTLECYPAVIVLAAAAITKRHGAGDNPISIDLPPPEEAAQDAMDRRCKRLESRCKS